VILLYTSRALDKIKRIENNYGLNAAIITGLEGMVLVTEPLNIEEAGPAAGWIRYSVVRPGYPAGFT
jgi:hypothetical protein